MVLDVEELRPFLQPAHGQGIKPSARLFASAASRKVCTPSTNWGEHRSSYIHCRLIFITQHRIDQINTSSYIKFIQHLNATKLTNNSLAKAFKCNNKCDQDRN